jgi:hypothetical protein
MNCKSDQMAWIVVPRSMRGSGLEQLDGHMVRTVALLPGYGEPIWAVTPRQTVIFKLPSIDRSGRHINPGDKLTADGIPDAYLRPFDPRGAPEALTTDRELEQPA